MTEEADIAPIEIDGFRGYRRRIRIAPQHGRIDVDLEDDFHRFGVTVRHDGRVVRHVETRELRFPWTSCPAAAAFLRERMTGAVLAEAGASEDQHQHCTHYYDLFILAAAHAGDETGQVLDIAITDPVDGVRVAGIARDGARLLHWRLGAGVETGGIPDDDRAIKAMVRDLPAELQEAARMLRRGLFIAQGRTSDWDIGQTADEIPIKNVCFTFQSSRSAGVRRAGDPRRDFSDRPDVLLRS